MRKNVVIGPLSATSVTFAAQLLQKLVMMKLGLCAIGIILFPFLDVSKGAVIRDKTMDSEGR